MCTIVLLRRPNHRWPLLVAANRDERLDRAWAPPAPHWPSWPGVTGGLDHSAGGTWMALGPQGVMAAVLNRPGSLGPEAGKRSRGELPLMAASAASAGQALAALGALDARAWRPFNLVIADAHAAFFLRGTGATRIEVEPLDEGVTMVTAQDPNDPASPRIRRHLPRFRDAAPPDPDADDWSAWEGLLADGDYGEAGIAEALRVPPARGFGTVCASLLALGAQGGRRWRFCPGPAGSAPFRDLDIAAA
ncbi:MULTISPECIES: NRDE family protein [Roseomonadaceae]|uniref:NRDE family protein n=1 Tax=Falsiroseomonas oleicola TaxID=2801474 RepID=A0ABS6HFI8_9PROT|nr:NRDE family protein [Roseomonas oleicola]MBU8546055.1 NRDE family protein [Roseomonas oleicola]